MTDFTWEGDIKLAVISTDVEERQKCKLQNEQLTWDLKKKKKNLNMKIREQIKDWKNIYAERVTVERIKKKKKKEKKEPENVVRKRKKNEQKKKRWTIRTLFIFI